MFMDWCLFSPTKVKTLEEKTLFPYLFIPAQNVDTMPRVAGVTLQSGGRHMPEMVEQENGTQAVVSARTACFSAPPHCITPEGCIYIVASAFGAPWTTILRATMCMRPSGIV